MKILLDVAQRLDRCVKRTVIAASDTIVPMPTRDAAARSCVGDTRDAVVADHDAAVLGIAR